jgi:hypothetical protein
MSYRKLNNVKKYSDYYSNKFNNNVHRTYGAMESTKSNYNRFIKRNNSLFTILINKIKYSSLSKRIFE